MWQKETKTLNKKDLAYIYYLHGRYYAKVNDIELSIEYFKKSIFLDELFTDREHYEEIHTIEQKNERVEVYNIEVSRNRTYFAENYLVHHFCETCAGFSKRI